MHVALNAAFLDPGVSGGLETVLRGLAPALRAARPGLRVTTLTSRRGAAALRAEGWPDVVALATDEGERARRLAAEELLVPAWCARRRVDVLHSISGLGPVATPRVAHVVTVHDLTFRREPTFSRATSLAMETVIRGAVRDADALTSGSAAAVAEVAPVLGRAAADFTVVPHGVERRAPVAPASAYEVRERHALPEGVPVLLCVAAKRPHKNQELLLRALGELGREAVLVLAGHPEPYDAQLRVLADELAVTEAVRFVDYVPDAELAALWELAAVAAFPTRGEGFGLPVVEALGHGVPVACSDLAVLREVGGEHVRTFGVDDPAGCAAALRAALDGPFDAAAARAHAASFTWAAAAGRYLEVYDRACSTSG